MKHFIMQSITMLLLNSFSLMSALPIEQSNATIFKNICKEMSTCIGKELTMQELQLEIIGGVEEKEFLRTGIMSNLQNMKWSFTASDKIIVTPSEIRTVYESIDDEDFVKRTCLLNAEIRLETASSSRILECKGFQLSDTIAKASIPTLEIPSYPFCMANIPGKESTLFDGIIKPVMYVLTFGFSAYLLFGVRSSD
ncbi:MAG: hypothetical protein RL734_1799 [Bacteroidota bacterium]|jgi:hypothetical protein